MNLLISVKPHWAEKITSGEKIWELRKLAPREGVKLVIVYATSPASKIVAVTDLDRTMIITPARLWLRNHCRSNPACISEKDFWKYYEGKETAYALILSNPRSLNIPLTEIRGIKPKFHPPQSYIYLPDDNDLVQTINKKTANNNNGNN